MAPFWKSAEEKEKKEKVVESGSGNRYGAGIASFLFHVAAYELLGKTLFPKLLKWSKLQRGKLRVLGVIPARYNSTRFPGKPLADLGGHPMIYHTYSNAKSSNCFDKLVVATDDERIADKVKEFGGEVVMTSESCTNGTERCLEVVELLKGQGKAYDIVVNVQGDEPFIEAEHIVKAVNCIKTGIEEGDSSVVMGTLARPANVDDAADVTSVNNVKVVLDCNYNALYFSRAMIPHNKKGKYDSKCLYWRKLGIYSYRADFLHTYVHEMPASLLQTQEDLEQNKVIEAGYNIRVGLVEKAVHGVDTPEQLKHLNSMLKTNKGIYI